MDELITEGLSPRERKSLVRQAQILAEGADEHISALMERLEYKEQLADHHTMKVEAAERAARSAAVEGIAKVEIDDCLDPHGDYVYILWGDTEPIYVGRSSNILGRLGSHMNDSGKRNATKTIQLIRCVDKTRTAETELILIDRYRPRLNISGNPDKRS